MQLSFMWLIRLANKRYYQIVVLMITTVCLSACGFQLRGTQSANLSQKTILIQSESPFGQLEKALKKQLTQSGAKIVALEETPQLHLRLFNFEINSQGASRDATGRANEIILRARLEYQLSTAQELELEQQKQAQAENTEKSQKAESANREEPVISVMKVSRSYYQNYRNPISEQTIRKQTQEEIVAELVRRLALKLEWKVGNSGIGN